MEGQVAVEVIARRIATKVILLAAAKLTERVHENVDRIHAEKLCLKTLMSERQCLTHSERSVQITFRPTFLPDSFSVPSPDVPDEQSETKFQQ